MSAEHWGSPCGELGPTVISFIGAEPEITMKTSLLAAIRCSLMFFLPAVAYPISSQWVMDPISGDWNTADNWTNGVPNGPADIAVFDGTSSTLDISISENTKVNRINFTAAGTPTHTITAGPGLMLTLSGAGITNDSGPGVSQNFVTAGGGVNIGRGQIDFTNNATAGINTRFTNNASGAINATGGVTFFHDNSRAGDGVFFNKGATFNTLGGGGGGGTAFSENSHAANGEFFNFGGTVAGATGGFTVFDLNSHADSAVLVALGGFNGGEGGKILFFGNSDGGTSQIEVHGNGTLDLSSHNDGDFKIGSLAGDGKVEVGGAALSLDIGGNNLDTTFSGTIHAPNSGTDLVKEGTGTLTLSGNAAVGGDSDIFHGVLQVDGSLRSINTFVFKGGTLAGSGTVHNDVHVQEGGSVSPGSVGTPGLLTVDGTYTQGDLGTLNIQIAGADDFSALEVFGPAFLSGTLEPVLLNGFMPAPGDAFDFLFAHSLDGEFSTIANARFDHLQWVVDYGETMATLRVISVASIPDQGSTFLLLTLGLLGLVTYRRQMTCPGSFLSFSETGDPQ
jgi:autotransporter-associated beta strand protein